MQPQLIVEQKITAFVNQYRIYNIDQNGQKNQLVAFAQQKRLAIKERVDFYSDESKTQKIFSFRAEKAMDIHGRFFVEDANDQMIGVFKKEFKQSLFNSTWSILDQNDQPKLTIKESNELLAVARRFAGFIPIVGDIFEIILMFLKYHFVLLTSDGKQLGKYRKTTLFRDHYELSLQPGTFETVDWRVVGSLCVALDALQGR